MESKRCILCLESKPLQEYYYNASTGNFGTKCKACTCRDRKIVRDKKLQIASSRLMTFETLTIQMFKTFAKLSEDEQKYVIKEFRKILKGIK